MWGYRHKWISTSEKMKGLEMEGRKYPRAWARERAGMDVRSGSKGEVLCVQHYRKNVERRDELGV